MTPYAWFKNILNRRNLEFSDGRPLYQYRLSQEEFDSLNSLLSLTTSFGSNDILKISYWDACLVIYASEWWRRSYEGKWGWAEVFQSVGIDQINLSTLQRNQLVQSGLRAWKRKIRKKEDGTRKFLGTIATEGGLPLHQLAKSSSGGWLNSLLKPVLKKHLSKNIPIALLLSAYKDHIPTSYQSQDLLVILEDILIAITALRKKHPLQEKSSPVEWLDNNEPNWREKFPLPLEHRIAASLLDDLVNTAANEKETQEQSFVNYEYSLVKSKDDTYKLLLQLNVDEFLYLDDLQDEIINNQLAVCQIEVITDSGERILRLRGVHTVYKNKDVIRLLGKRGIHLSDNSAIGRISWRLISIGKVIFSELVTEGLQPQNQTPWLFKKVDDHLIYTGSASCKVSLPTALVYLPDGFTFTCQEENGSSFRESGTLFDGKLFELTGTVTCHYEDSQFKLSTGLQEDTSEFTLEGRLLSNHSLIRHTSPIEVYLGLPKLTQVNTITGISSKREVALLTRMVGSKAELRPIRDNERGVQEIRHLDGEKNIIFKKCIGLIYEHFRIKIKPLDSDTGYIYIGGIEGFEVIVSTTTVVSTIKHMTSGYEIFLKSNDDVPPEDIKLSLQPRLGREIDITVPFPAKGAFLFAPSGQRIDMTTPLFLGDLMGYRVRVQEPYSTNRISGTLEFQLKDGFMDYCSTRELYIREYIELDEQLTEFSVYDWIQPIETLLNISTNHDAAVKVSFDRSGRSYFQLTIRQFASLMKPDFTTGTLYLSERARKRFSSEELRNTEIQALYLQQPAQKYNELVQEFSENTPLGKWKFDDKHRANGSWILYPKKSSSLSFRPALWNIGEYFVDVQDASSLGKAAAVSDNEQRANAIHLLLKAMANNSNHSGWNYIDDLWDKTSHLPLATFDLWKVSVTEPSFLVALFLKKQNEILQRIEQELPLLWELIPFSTWWSALNDWKETTWKTIGYENSLRDELLEQKIKEIGGLSPAMKGVEKLLLLKHLKKSSLEIQAIDYLLTEELSGERQSLLRQPQSKQWPELLQRQLIDSFSKSACSSITSLHAPNNFQSSVFFLPAVLAQDMLVGSSFTSKTLTSVDIFKIKQIKQFAPYWFDRTFQMLTIWIHQYLCNKGNQH